MLKRYQILLDEWIADFAKTRSDRFDMSFSENVRLALCIYYGTMISELYPDFKFKYTLDKVTPVIHKYSGTEESEEKKHKLISEIYYEARKAMEYYTHQQAKGARPVGKA